MLILSGNSTSYKQKQLGVSYAAFWANRHVNMLPYNRRDYLFSIGKIIFKMDFIAVILPLFGNIDC